MKLYSSNLRRKDSFKRDRWLPLETNFGKGRMKALVEEASKVHTISNNTRMTYRVGFVCDCMGVSMDALGTNNQPSFCIFMVSIST